MCNFWLISDQECFISARWYSTTDRYVPSTKQYVPSTYYWSRFQMATPPPPETEGGGLLQSGWAFYGAIIWAAFSSWHNCHGGAWNTTLFKQVDHPHTCAHWMRPAARAGREIRFQKARNIQEYPWRYHVYTTIIPLWCIYIKWYIMYMIHGLGYTMY
jgi:hypothetical protein